jgi:H+-transporting ATPase
LPDTSIPAWRLALAKFWAPVPWMLEAAVVLQAVLHEYVQAAVITGLLVFNAALGFFQEGRAQATLAALKSRLAIIASVRRDGAWANVAAAELVPGDAVRLSLGGVVPADVKLTGGSVLLDQSSLTGESVPAEVGPGVRAYAGAMVRRGEATAVVTATGARTKFGHTAALVRGAHVESTQQRTVVRVVRNIALFNGVIIVLLTAYAHASRMAVGDLVPLVLTAILASIPVALPATFTLASALGAKALARVGVLPTRLSAVDEAATLDVLCSDKTGTLTCNELTVTALRAEPGFDERHLLAMAALASDEAGQDPVDTAIRFAARKRGIGNPIGVVKFVPFDPATKMSEATAVDAKGATVRAVKGAFAAVLALTGPLPTAAVTADELEGKGFRVLAVAVGTTKMQLVGIIALSDPPRSDAADLIRELRDLGVRVVMVTGDAPVTAAIVAREVGLDGATFPLGPIPHDLRPEDFTVFAGVLPEGKYRIVEALQRGGHTVGMCGDGANDAPALRQAQMGIAVSTATDVAKAAAGVVLTTPGLGGVVAAVKEGRIAFQRILTYTLNSVTKKIVQVMFLAAGVVLTGHAILTPMLMVIIMITGDFLGMSLTTDNVRPSPTPSVWRVGNLTLAGVLMGTSELAFCVAALAVGKFRLGLGTEQLRTLAFLVIVFGNQATTYPNRTRSRMWSPPPSVWVVLASAADLAIASVMAGGGIAMARLPLFLIAGLAGVATVFAFAVDLLKVPMFRRLKIA